MNIKEVEFEGQLPIELTNMIVTPNQLIGLDEKDIKHVVNGGKGKAFIFEQEEEDYPTFMKNSFNTLGEKNEVKGGKYILLSIQTTGSTLNMEMGTTMVMASIQNAHLTIAHVGDSRCYHFRKKEGCIFQTQDHVKNCSGWEIVARCFFTGRPDVAIPEIHQATLQRGDKILLCSDGLYKSMPTDILKEKVMEEKSPAEKLDEFDLLCEESGDDNYSGILLEILDI